MATVMINLTSEMMTNNSTTHWPMINLTTEMITNNSTTHWPTSTEIYTMSETTGTRIPTTAAPDQIPEYWGFITAGIAILFYGSNFVPIKKFETGDGMFFQWIMCSAVMVCGIVVHLIRGQPPFFPLAMVGGVIWSFGNICVVPIVKTVGLGLGMCIWGMINLLGGWATGRFGWFGVTASVPNNEVMNYIGVGLCVCSAAVFALIKNEITPIQSSESEPLLTQRARQDYSSQSGEALYTTTNTHDVLVFSNRRRNSNSINMSDVNEDGSFIDRMSPGTKRVVGLVLCVFSGLMYGQMFTGATYVQDHKDQYPGATDNGLDYVFSCFCGIYITSTVFFCIYIAFMKNKPKVYPRVILPGMISGAMWAIATSSWFVANRALSIPVAFPLVTTGPSIVGSIWTTVVFREIRGTRNLLFLFLGFSVAITGAVLAGVSKS